MSLDLGDSKEEWTPDNSRNGDIKIKDQLQQSPPSNVKKIGEVSHMFSNKGSYLTPFNKNISLKRQKNLAAPIIPFPDSG